MIDWLTEPLGYGFVTRALAELMLLAVLGGTVGCWIVLYRISYAAESLAHGMLPGLALASLVGLPLIAGGAAGIVLAGILIAVASRLAPDRTDTAVAVVVTTLFGAGVLIALAPAGSAGLQSLLFGDPLGVGDRDLMMTAILVVVVLLALWRWHDRLLAVGFDGGAGSGLSPTLIPALLFSLVAVTVLAGVQGLGTLLVAAILIGPAAAARVTADRPGRMFALGIAFAVAAGICGIYLSYYARIAAGAAVVLCLVGLYAAVAGLNALTVAGHRRAAGRIPADLPKQVGS